MNNKNSFAIFVILISIGILLFYTKNLYSNNNLIKFDINSANSQTLILNKKISELQKIDEKYKSLKIDSIKTRRGISESEGFDIDKYMPSLSEDKILDVLTNNEYGIIFNEISFKKSSTLSDGLDIMLVDAKFQSRNPDEINNFLEYLTGSKSEYAFFVNSLEFENKKELRRSELIEVKMQIGIFDYSK